MGKTPFNWLITQVITIKWGDSIGKYFTGYPNDCNEKAKCQALIGVLRPRMRVLSL